MHADTGLLAVMGSVCMMLALVLAWCLGRSPVIGLLFLFFLLFEHLTMIYATVAPEAALRSTFGESVSGPQRSARRVTR